MVADITKRQDVSNLNKLTYATVGVAAMFMGQKLFAYVKKAFGEKMHPTKRCREPGEIGSQSQDPCRHTNMLVPTDACNQIATQEEPSGTKSAYPLSPAPQRKDQQPAAVERVPGMRFLKKKNWQW